VLSFGFFSLHEQRKETCRGSATHKYTRLQAAQMKSRPKGDFVIYPWMPAFAGMTTMRFSQV
jgi:hypothetical protein